MKLSILLNFYDSLLYFCWYSFFIILLFLIFDNQLDYKKKVCTSLHDFWNATPVHIFLWTDWHLILIYKT